MRLLHDIISKEEYRTFRVWLTKTPTTVIIIILHKLDRLFSLIPQFDALFFHIRVRYRWCEVTQQVWLLQN